MRAVTRWSWATRSVCAWEDFFAGQCFGAGRDRAGGSTLGRLFDDRHHRCLVRNLAHERLLVLAFPPDQIHTYFRGCGFTRRHRYALEPL